MASKSKVNISIFYRLVSYTKPYRRFFLISIFCTILLSIIGPLRPALIGNMVDTYIIKSQNKEALVNWILLILGLLLLEGVFQLIGRYFSNLLAQ